MEIAFSVIVGIVLLGLWAWSNFHGVKCPVCKSVRCWELGYFGKNTSKDKIYCKNCFRAVQNPITKQFTVFDEPQEFHK